MPAQSQPGAAARSAASSRSHFQEPAASETSQERDATPEELAILRLVSEQGGMTVGHLASFFDVYRSDMERFVGELKAKGWVKAKQFVTAEDVWVWLRHRGCVLAATGHVMTPIFPRKLPHWHAMNEARLFLAKQEPDGVWVCERELRRRNRRRRRHRHKFVPDAVFVIRNEHGEPEHHAIEVELSRKPVELLRNIIVHHSARYDAVVYLCSVAVMRYMRRLKLTEEYPTLIVRELTDDVRLLRQEKFWVHARGSVPVDRESGAEPWEEEVLRLLSEQGAIPLDQLARFLGSDEAAADRIASHLLERGYIRRAHPFPDESDWVWLTKRGVRVSGTDCSAADPKLGGLSKLRAVNEIRLLFKERTPGARWLSGRLLRRASGNSAPRLSGVVEIDGERHAIEVRLGRAPDPQLESLIRRLSEDYDGVIFFCAGQLYRALKRMEKSGRCPKLVVASLPGSGKARSPRSGNAAAVVMAEISPQDLPQEARSALFAAHPDGANAKIFSVEQRLRPVRSRFRIVTADGIWQLAKSRQGWRAKRYEDRAEAFAPREIVLEIGESLPGSEKRPGDQKSETVMAKVSPQELPDRARTAFLAASGGGRSKLVSVEKRIGPRVSPRYRLVTSDGIWRVVSCRTGWQVRRYENVEAAYRADEIRLQPGELYVPPDFLNERQRSLVAEAIEGAGSRCSLKGHMERFGIATNCARRDLVKLVELGLMSRQATSGRETFFMPVPDIGPRLEELDAQHQRLREAQAQASVSEGVP